MSAGQNQRQLEGFSRRCRANVARIRQSSTAAGLGFQFKVLNTFEVVPSSLGSGPRQALRGGISKVYLQENLSIFGNKCPQNGSKNDKMAPRTTRRYPHEGPRAVNLIAERTRAGGGGVKTCFRVEDSVFKFQGLGLGLRVYGSGFGRFGEAYHLRGKPSRELPGCTRVQSLISQRFLTYRQPFQVEKFPR